MTTKNEKWYVTMTDRFLSGWGMAENKINKLVIECNSLDQARQVEKAANERSEMKHVSITDKKPYYNKARYLTSEKHYDDLGSIWKPDMD